MRTDNIHTDIYIKRDTEFICSFRYLPESYLQQPEEYAKLPRPASNIEFGLPLITIHSSNTEKIPLDVAAYRIAQCIKLVRKSCKRTFSKL
jgi:hypothetical protein